MNDRFIINFLKVVAACVVFYTGLVHFMIKLFVRKGLLIFNYHGFNTFANDYWRFGSLFASNYATNFEKQVRFFDRHFQKLSDFRLEESFGPRPVYFLTFDDGYKDNFDIALPVLKKHRAPGVFFIVTGCIGTDVLLWHDAIRLRYEQERPKGVWGAARAKRKSKDELRRLKETWEEKKDLWPERASANAFLRLMMNWEEVLGASAAGVLIGAHTSTHPILSRVSPESQKKEILTAVEAIRTKMGRAPEFFSYPEGSSASFNRHTVDILKELGVRYALTTERGINGPTDLPYSLKRIGINPSDPLPVAALKIALAGLGSKLHLKKFRQRRAEIRLSIHQYGPFNALKRAIKAVLRKLGVRMESHYILHRNLAGPLETAPPIEGLIARTLSFKDFEASRFFDKFSVQKRNLLKGRFSSPDYQAFGAELDGELVYMAWIATDFLRIEGTNYEQKLEKGEGVLLDALTLPGARGLGIHGYMNKYRLSKLKEKGVKKAYVAVLKENRPALKTQFKCGFRQGERILWVRAGRFSRHFKKDVRFPSAEGKELKV